MNLFDDLDEADRALLLDGVHRHRFARDEFILAQEDNTDDVFFVFNGVARATIFGSDGSFVGYRDISDGELFGEFAAIDGKPRSASVIAVEDCEVGIITAARFRNVVRENPRIAWVIIQHLTGQARAMTQRIFEYSTMLVRERLIREILRMAESGDETDEGLAISPAPSQVTLASRISTHREGISREMSRLMKLGILSRRKDALIVHRRDDLEALLERADLV
ncbi:MAG: Crp/Fnr family transcriptional regulator [Pseudomonadota bacterium]